MRIDLFSRKSLLLCIWKKEIKIVDKIRYSEVIQRYKRNQLIITELFIIMLILWYFITKDGTFVLS